MARCWLWTSRPPPGRGRVTLASVVQAIGLFIATNKDDIIVRALFFGHGAGKRGITVRILAGQYTGCRHPERGCISAPGGHPVLRTHPAGARTVGRLADLARRRRR